MYNKENVSVVGAGIMGHSIALAASWADYKVKVWGTDDNDISNGKLGLENKLDVLMSYDVLHKEKKEQILRNITFTNSLNECVADATFVIEAIPEKLTLKQKYFTILDKLCPKNVIIGSNTSGLSATNIAKHTNNPSRTIITHFWLPAHLMPLVEVVKGEHTSDNTADRALSLLESMNKKPILVKKDVLGSVGNRLQYAVFREAQHILKEEIASMEDIDAAIRYSIGRRFGVTGPFMTMDMGGLETNASITSYLFEDLSDRKTIFPYMEELIQNKEYGPKTGKGFYNWTEDLKLKMEKEREEELIHWLKKDIKKENK